MGSSARTRIAQRPGAPLRKAFLCIILLSLEAGCVAPSWWTDYWDPQSEYWEPRSPLPEVALVDIELGNWSYEGLEAIRFVVKSNVSPMKYEEAIEFSQRWTYDVDFGGKRFNSSKDILLGIDWESKEPAVWVGSAELRFLDERPLFPATEGTSVIAEVILEQYDRWDTHVRHYASVGIIEEWMEPMTATIEIADATPRCSEGISINQDGETSPSESCSLHITTQIMPTSRTPVFLRDLQVLVDGVEVASYGQLGNPIIAGELLDRRAEIPDSDSEFHAVLVRARSLDGTVLAEAANVFEYDTGE